jgi:hypothetical protein
MTAAQRAKIVADELADMQRVWDVRGESFRLEHTLAQMGAMTSELNKVLNDPETRDIKLRAALVAVIKSVDKAAWIESQMRAARANRRRRRGAKR